VGTPLTGLLPTIDGSTFTAGEVLVIAQASINELIAYYDVINYSAPFGGPLDPAATMATLLNSDVAQVKAALPSFKKLGFRVYSDNLAGTVEVGWFTGTIMPAAVAAGIDATYTGPTFVGGASNVKLAQLRNDYKSFFGI
jgi:hypothetical protein